MICSFLMCRVVKLAKKKSFFCLPYCDVILQIPLRQWSKIGHFVHISRDFCLPGLYLFLNKFTIHCDKTVLVL